MGRRIALFAVLLGTVVTLVATAGILEGTFVRSDSWQPFVAAVGGVVLGFGLIAWGGIKYAGVGARI